jgi:predicted site-specific integrase-resolvase
MTPRKVPDPDAITVQQASVIAGISIGTAQRFRREGHFTRLPGRKTYSRREAEQLAQDPLLSGVEAAEILGVSHARVTQLANVDKIPYRRGASGRRFYKRSQLEVVANARDARKFGFKIESASHRARSKEPAAP